MGAPASRTLAARSTLRLPTLRRRAASAWPNLSPIGERSVRSPWRWSPIARDHGPLALAEMPAVKVQTDDKGGRIAAVVDPVGRQHGGEPAGEVTVAPVENATLAVEPDGLSEAMAANVVDEAVEVGAGHHRKGLGDGMVGTEGFVQVRHQKGFSVPSVVDSASQHRRAYSHVKRLSILTPDRRAKLTPSERHGGGCPGSQ